MNPLFFLRWFRKPVASPGPCARNVRIAALYREQQELMVKRAQAKKSKKAVAPYDKALRANRCEAMRLEGEPSWLSGSYDRQ